MAVLTEEWGDLEDLIRKPGKPAGAQAQGRSQLTGLDLTNSEGTASAFQSRTPRAASSETTE